MIRTNLTPVLEMPVPLSSLRRFLGATQSYCIMQLRQSSVQVLLKQTMHECFDPRFIARLRTILNDPQLGAGYIKPTEPFQPNYDELARWVCGLGCLLGQPFCHWNRGSAVFRNHLIHPAPSRSSLRIATRPDPLHTDTLAPSASGEDYAVFGCCHRISCEGGETELLHIKDWPQLEEFLRSDFAWVKHEMYLGDPAFQGRTMNRPVFWSRDGLIQVCWSPRNIRRWEPPHARWLDEITAALHSAPRSFRRVIAPGEVIIFDNRRWLHGRAALVERDGLDRLLLAAHVSRRCG